MSNHFTHIDAAHAAKAELVTWDDAEVLKAAKAAGVTLDLEKFKGKSLLGSFVTRNFRGFIATETLDAHDRIAWLLRDLSQRLARAGEQPADYLAWAAALNEAIRSHVALAELELKLAEIQGHSKNPKGTPRSNLPDIHADVAYVQQNIHPLPPAPLASENTLKEANTLNHES